MTMSLNLRIVCISYAEPLLWLPVVASSLAALFTGTWLGRSLARIAPRTRRHFVGGAATLTAAFAMLLLPWLLLQLLFTWIDGDMVCTTFVAPLLLIPLLLGLEAEAFAWHHTARQAVVGRAGRHPSRDG
jgi:hypothetical protein